MATTTVESPGVEFASPLGGTLEEYADALAAFLGAWRALIDMTSVTSACDGSAEKAAHFLPRRHWETRVSDPAWRAFLLRQSEGGSDEERFLRGLLDVQCGRAEALEAAGAPPSLAGFVRRAALLAPATGVDAARHGARRAHNEGPLRNARSAADVALGLMSQKKKLETHLLGACVAELSARHAVDTVVDIGAGKGYFTQWLQVRCPDVRVVAVEGSDAFAASFRRRAEILQAMTAERVQGAQERPNAAVIAARVPLGVDSAQFIAQLALPRPPQRALLTGLHTCGDLAPTIMKLFLRAPEAKVLALVGCCYHMLTEMPIPHPPASAVDVAELAYGFPLSRQVRDRMDFFLDTGRHLASNVLPQFTSVEDLRHSLVMQSYRAALEGFLNQRCNPGGEPFSHHVGNMRSRFGGMTFGIYTVRAVRQIMRKLGPYTQVPEEYKQRLRQSFAAFDLGDESDTNPLAVEANEYFRQLNPTASGIVPAVGAFAALRNLLGPLVEALVVCDRVLFLREQAGAELSDLRVVRIFSPDISPRSFVLIAVKN